MSQVLARTLSSLSGWESFLLYSIAILILSYCILQWRSRRQTQRKRQATLDQWIAKAQTERDEKSFQVLENHLKPTAHDELLTAAETRRRIVDGTLNAQDNIVFLSKRCRECGRGQVNAITEELYDEAYHLAGDISGGSVKDRPLQGVPISVKDCIAIQGTFATGGMACRLNEKSTKNSLVFDLLKDAGAIPLCRGNTMQLMYSIESVNRIWGRTSNPWDMTRTPGGSSGGDAALVAMGCVPLAIATDLGGSVRLPAAVCGVVGFKPTSTRISVKGNTSPRKVGWK